jgi:hypothetical protein
MSLYSVEELGWAPRSNTPAPAEQRRASPNGNNGNHNGQRRLRHRLCLLIRHHQLDDGLVKAYARLGEYFEDGLLDFMSRTRRRIFSRGAFCAESHGGLLACGKRR